MVKSVMRNSANYKKGCKYKFIIAGLEQFVEILDKGDKKLQLKLESGQMDWFDWSDITVVRERKPVVKNLAGLDSIQNRQSKITRKVMNPMTEKPVKVINEVIKDWQEVCGKKSLVVAVKPVAKREPKSDEKDLEYWKNRAQQMEHNLGWIRGFLRKIWQSKGIGLELTSSSPTKDYIEVAKEIYENLV